MYVEVEPHVVAVSAAVSRAFSRSLDEEKKFLDNLSKASRLALEGRNWLERGLGPWWGPSLCGPGSA